MKKTLLSCSLIALFVSQTLNAATVDFRVIETTDLHGNMMNFDYYKNQSVDTYGLVKTANLIKKVRAEQPNVVLVDNGDLIQGSPMADYAVDRGVDDKHIHPVYTIMNELNYTVGNFGNHEFNFGLDFLKQSIKGAQFPYINANIYDAKTGEPVFNPYLIVETPVIDKDGNKQIVKVGYIGFVPPQIMQWDKLNLDGKVVVKDIKQTAEHYVPIMKKEGADIIIAIPHSGISGDPYKAMAENSVYYLSEVPGINAIMFGHSHGVFPSESYASIPNTNIELGTVNGIPAVMPGQWGSHLGVVDLVLEGETGDWKVTSGKAEARPIFDAKKQQALVDADQNLVNKLSHDHEGTKAFMSKPIGKVNTDVNSYLALIQESPSIKIINDAQIDYVKHYIQGDPDLDGLPVLSSVAPFKAGGRKNDPSAYVDVSKGELSFRNASDIYLYPNTLSAIKVKGGDVQEWLECAAGLFNQIDPNSEQPQELINWETFRTYNYDVMDGVQYQVDVTQPARYNAKCELVNPNAHRIANLTFNGQPIDLNQTFLVATNNYRAYTGEFPGTGSDKVQFTSPDDMRVILSQYITKQTLENGQVDVKLNQNWRLKPIQTDKKLDIRFESAKEAQDKIKEEATWPITYLNQDDVGFGVYQIDLQAK